ncbi:hypothetical protein R6Z02_14505 [Carnobacterium maltaromaticum]|uniref:hypothetical protein n=1 Tax=Carnobacterium maltaromaticum TaxID=2751 RepID=UPI00298A37D1|nr:hypothetical protein [Carnobacterium maltaromaticum]MDW5524967.1 hypothetical protein [Carnobacterium maltaromaticum]
MNTPTFEEIENELIELKHLIASYPSNVTKEQQLQLNKLKKELTYFQHTYKQIINSHEPVVKKNKYDW